MKQELLSKIVFLIENPTMINEENKNEVLYLIDNFSINNIKELFEVRDELYKINANGNKKANDFKIFVISMINLKDTNPELAKLDEHNKHNCKTDSCLPCLKDKKFNDMLNFKKFTKK